MSKTIKVFLALIVLALSVTACNKGKRKTSLGDKSRPQQTGSGPQQPPASQPNDGITAGGTNGNSDDTNPAGEIAGSQNQGTLDEDEEFSADDVSGSEVISAESDTVSSKIKMVPARPSREDYIEPQIFTGAATSDKYLYTDAKNDAVMFHLVGLMNKQEEKLRQDSTELALRVKDVTVDVNIYQKDSRGHHVNAKVIVKEAGQNIEFKFAGVLNADRTASLRQLSGQQKGYTFAAKLWCLDTDTISCQNTVLQLEHIREEKVCKRIFIVHRWGNAAFEMTKHDYVSFDISASQGYQAFGEYLANTVLFRKLRMRESLNEYDRDIIDPMPRAKELGLKTWAVALGGAHFELRFVTENYQDSVPTYDIAGKKIENDVVFYGDMVSREKNTELLREVSVRGQATSFTDVPNVAIEYAKLIHSAYLTGNDGRGHLGLHIRFKGPEEAAMNLEFTTRVNNVVDVSKLIQ